jgi:flagellum-specific ATP synthase
MTVDLAKYCRKLEHTTPRARGTVLRVAGMVVESRGPMVGIGQLCEICPADGRRVPAEVVGFHQENRILLPLENIEGVAPGDPVAARTAPRTIALDESVLGRVIDAMGKPIDNLGPLRGRDLWPLDNKSPAPMSRQKITQPLVFGIRAMDGLLTTGRGQRIGIFSGSGVGKSTLLGEIARVSDADVNVLALVGERGREVRQFIEESLGPSGLARSVVLVAAADVSPIQRVKVAFTAIAVAEYFRDRGKNVLFMMDSITRFAQAQREIGLAAGEPPTSKGYCPSVFSLLPKITERLGCTERGSITGVFTTLVEGDEMDDPIADSVRSLLDGHIVLSRKLAEMGHYPAIDILQSISRLMNSIASKGHLQASQKLRAIYSTYQRAEDLINIGAVSPGANPRLDKAVALIEKVNQFLIQPTGQSCRFERTVSWLDEITRSWDAPDAATSRGAGAMPASNRQDRGQAAPPAAQTREVGR